MKNIIVVTEDFTATVALKSPVFCPEEQLIAKLQSVFKDTPIIAIADADTHHACLYCRGIAEGSNPDLLCEECKCAFCHKYYSEL